MDFESKYGFLHSNQKLLIKECIKRNIEVEVIHQDLELIIAKLGNHIETILDRDSSIMPYSTSVLVGDKMITKNFLSAHGISVPIGKSFNIEAEDYILKAFDLFDNSVVIKPVFGSHGENVHLDLKTRLEVKEALESIRKIRGPKVNVIIEEFFKGKEYRVFLTKDGEYAVLYREPAHVIGNGINTILELAIAETQRRMFPRTNALCPILIDETVEKYLSKNGLSLNSIPANDEKVYLRENSNVASGGLCIDYTDRVDMSVIENCIKVFEAFPNLPYAGIDYMTEDCEALQTRQMYRILEVNSNPGIHMHASPAIGESRNIAAPLTDLIFPETREGKSYVKKFKRIL
jgi:glutamate--cysteine ligase